METASGSGAMSLGHIDDEKYFLITHEIMTAEEFTEFTDNRKSFNQNILNGKATREELLVQITLESMILNTCEQKIKQVMREAYTGEFNSKIKSILSNRIHDMYIELFKTFKYDVNLVSKYIQFGLENKRLTKNYKIVLDDIMDSFHSDSEIYITGAHHAFTDCNDIESARRYISFGIKFHEDLKKLYVEDFWIEVKNLNQTGDTSLLATLTKYNNIIQHFEGDFDLHFDLVDTALDEHIKMTQLQSIVIRDMVNKYRRNELMWQKLAKIHLNGFVYNYDTDILHKIQSMRQHISIRNYINTYNKALTESLSPKSKQNLWDLFLDDILDIYSLIDSDDQVTQDFMKKSIDRTFALAYSTNSMKQPRHFLFWVERNNGGDAEVAILRRGLNISNDNFEMWTKLFEYYLHHDCMRRAMKVLLDCVDILKDKALPLWEVMELCALSSDEEMIEDFYNKSSFIVNVEVINLRFRPAYLEWYVLTRDLASGRKIFNALKCLKPKCYDLYKRMIQFEKLSIISKKSKHIKYMRTLYSETCNLFGHADVELWCDCIKFEYMYGVPSLVGMIFDAGMNLLENPSLKAELTEMKYKLDAQYQENDVIHIEDEG
ncbi:U3 small nucleolar RNA-associated protein 6 homolog [Metopolophium dirhodum]|uniref:U3 small nucleolar RNA-associated protein 6 homolog n=1 Tax=Metopolophium dirhodum TaxID=44670 RepID=UPI0029903BB9|nr:U3 small nucleolar RNA-associated protein 6 homolog [Metopolophium dirhodum]